MMSGLKMGKQNSLTQIMTSFKIGISINILKF